MKKFLVVAVLVAALSVSAFAEPKSPGLWDFSTLDVVMPFESTGFEGDVGFGAGISYETNSGQGSLWHLGASFAMSFDYFMTGVYAEGGLSFVLDSAHGRAEWSAVGEDAYYTYSYTGTTGADFMYLLDVGFRGFAMWGDYDSSFYNAYAVVGPRYATVYNTVIAPFESVGLWAYGVVGYSSGAAYDYWGPAANVPGHIYFGAIVGARWWMFGAELRFMDNQFQFKFNTMIPFSWMPESS